MLFIGHDVHNYACSIRKVQLVKWFIHILQNACISKEFSSTYTRFKLQLYFLWCVLLIHLKPTVCVIMWMSYKILCLCPISVKTISLYNLTISYCRMTYFWRYKILRIVKIYFEQKIEYIFEDEQVVSNIRLVNSTTLRMDIYFWLCKDGQKFKTSILKMCSSTYCVQVIHMLNVHWQYILIEQSVIPQSVG